MLKIKNVILSTAMMLGLLGQLQTLSALQILIDDELPVAQGGLPTFPLTTASDESIENVKTMILDKHGIDVDAQKLYYGATLMEAPYTLATYNVLNNTIVKLVVTRL